MSSIFLILICLGAGVWLRRTDRLKDSAPAALNSVVLQVCLPALILTQIHSLPAGLEAGDPRVWFPILVPWGVFAGAWLFFTRWGAWKGWTRETQGALILVAGLGNTSFVGFPLVEALYGREALGTAVLLDQLGSFLALSTVGVAVASRYSTRSRTKSRGIGGLFRFPPFLALIAGFALRPVVFSESVVRVLERLALPLVPLALLAIGVQLGSRQSPDGRSRDGVSKVAWALGYKLLLAPLGIALLGSLAFRLSHRSGGMELCVGIIEAAMAPMITAAVVAEEFGLDPALGNRILAIGIPISLVTVPLWSVLLKALHLP